MYLKMFELLWNDLSHKEKVKLHRIHLAVINIDYYERFMRKREKLEMFVNTYDKSNSLRTTSKKQKNFWKKLTCGKRSMRETQI